MTVTISGTTGLAGVDGSAGTPAVQGTDTNTGLYFGADTVYVVTGGVAAQTVDSGQRTKFPTTIGIGGATPSTSGSGVSFPATQSASSNVNTLDDYEEGTFTAGITPKTSGSVTLNTFYQSGTYTKIGRLVTVCGQLILSSVSSPVGNQFYITGLPFTSSSAGLINYSVGVVRYDVDGNAIGTAYIGTIGENSSQIAVNFDSSTLAGNQRFTFTVTYPTST